MAKFMTPGPGARDCNLRLDCQHHSELLRQLIRQGSACWRPEIAPRWINFKKKTQCGRSWSNALWGLRQKETKHLRRGVDPARAGMATPGISPRPCMSGAV